jgi:hypothetical protein
MTSKDDPIPEDVRKAFDLAAKALFAWSAIGGDEPTVVVHGSPTLISAVATLAKPYNDMMMPADLYWRMVHHANCSPRRRLQASKLSHDSMRPERNVCWNGCTISESNPKCTRPQHDCLAPLSPG